MMYKKWWFWTIAVILVLPLYLLLLRVIGFATVDAGRHRVYDESAVFAEMSAAPSMDMVPSPSPVPAAEPAPDPTAAPTPSPTPATPPDWIWETPSIAEARKADINTPASTNAPASNPAPPSAISSEYAVFIMTHYQGIMSDMETFNQLDSQMKGNDGLLYDGTWLDALLTNTESLKSHCKKIIGYDKVPEGYADIHGQIKTGCQTLLDGLKTYIYGVDLMEGGARVEGRTQIQEAVSILSTAASSLS